MDEPEAGKTRTWLYLAAGLATGLGLGILVLFGLGGNFSRAGFLPGSKSGQSSPEVGYLAPDFDLVSVDGARVHLSDLRGELIIVNFWATWCTPCVEEMPNLQKYYQDIYPNQFEVLAINADESLPEVKQFVADMVLSFPILLDPGGLTQAAYRLRGYPTSFFIDKEGIIRYQHIGLLHEDQLANYLKKMGVGE